MTSPRWRRRVSLLPFAVLLLGTVIGGQINRIDAVGRIIDDTTGAPIPDVTVNLGSRATVTDANGRYELDNLPRGSRLNTQHRYYGKNAVAADQTELRVVPLTLTVEVHDVYTTKGVDTPEARQPADTQIGKGTATGEMVVGPYPNRGSRVLICAKDYVGVEVDPKGYQLNVDLTPSKGSGCPPLKSPPPPAQTPSPSPSGSGSPAPSPSPSPSGTP